MPADNDNEGAAPPVRSCPICGKPARVEWRPFCSKRCADVDLNRWLSDRYALPVADEEETAEPDDEGREP